MTTRPPVPPFTLESATQKVRLAEDSWNSRDPEKVSQGYTLDSRWRNRSEFVAGRQFAFTKTFSTATPVLDSYS
jgi:nuclear transport factor 2 (NTF2) superfamily protein